VPLFEEFVTAAAKEEWQAAHRDEGLRVMDVMFDMSSSARYRTIEQVSREATTSESTTGLWKALGTAAGSSGPSVARTRPSSSTPVLG
jgi:hypothetical protein